MKQQGAEQVLIRRIQRKTPFPFWIEQLLIALRRFRRFDMLGIEAKRDDEVIMRGPKSLLVHEVFGNALPTGREIGIDQSHLPQRVRLAGGNIDDVGERLPRARFGRELVEDAGSVGAVVFRSDERILLLKLIEQRLQLVDGGKTINDDFAFFFGAFDELLFAFFALEAVVGPKSRRALRKAERATKCQSQKR